MENEMTIEVDEGQAQGWTFPSGEAFVVETRRAMDRPEGSAKTGGLFVLLCLSGQGDILINRQRFHLGERSQVVLLPGTLVEADRVTDNFRMLRAGCDAQTFEAITSSFEPEFFRFIKESPCVTLPEEEDVLLREMVRLAGVALRDVGNAYRRQMLSNYIQNMLYHFYGRTRMKFQQTEVKWTDRKEELFKDFIALLHDHCTCCRDVAWYADRMNISPRYLSSIVAKASGETAKDIIARHVVAEIKVRLKTTRMNVQEISQEMNFINPSFFCRYFKKHTGMSPLQYRNEA